MNQEKKLTRREWENSIVSMTEAAELLDLSRQRVHVLLNNKQLDGFMVGNAWLVYRDSIESRLANKPR